MINYRKMEKLVRGFSNHRRIQIMDLLSDSEDLSVLEIANRLKIDYKTASDHIRRLAIPDLVNKRNQGSNVRHKLSPLGFAILKFLRRLE